MKKSPNSLVFSLEIVASAKHNGHHTLHYNVRLMWVCLLSILAWCTGWQCKLFDSLNIGIGYTIHPIMKVNTLLNMMTGHFEKPNI